MREIKKIQINEKVFHVHGLEVLILLKCPYYPKQSVNLMQPFQDSNKTNNPKIHMKSQSTLNGQSNLEGKRYNAGCIPLPDLKL